MKAIRTILFLTVIFIIVSCEKTEMIDSKIETGKCHMTYIFNPDVADNLLKVLFTTVDSIQVQKISEMTIEIRKIKKVQ